MAKIKDNGNILSLLRTDCFFPKTIGETEQRDGYFLPVLKNKIGHIRADHNGYRWWSTPWPLHLELEKKEIRMEIDAVFAALTDEDALRDLEALRDFCELHPEACAGTELRDEYDFFFEGEYCNFWIRCITRENDYNMYLNAFVKGD